MIEQTPLECNRVSLGSELDALGNFKPVLYYDFDDYTKAGMKAAIEVSNQIFAKAGITDATRFDPSNPSYLVYEGQPLIAYGAGHIVGTHRMGKTPRDSVTDSHGRCWDHPNLFVVGCGSMPTIGTSNPTLTLGALAMRSADAIAKELG